MLSPRYIAETPEFVLSQFREMENEIVKDVARRLNKIGTMTETSNFQLNIAYESTTSPVDINAKLDKALQGINLWDDLDKSAKYAMDSFGRSYERNVGELPFNYNPSNFMENIVDAVARQSKEEITALSKTTGFILDGNFVKREDYLREMLNKAAFQVSSGAFTYEQVARRYIKELGDKGVRVFNFESGTTREMESHLRRIILDATRQLSNELSIRNAEELGTDLMEISAHAGARPSHANWQGKILSLSGKPGYLSLNDIGYGDVAGFGGANCRHSMYPYFEGARKMYPPRVLKELEGRTHEYNGKTYTDYEASQRQRAMERGLRASQRRLLGLKELGDTNEYAAELIRYRRKMDGYKAFSNATGRKLRRDNLYIYRGPGGTFEEVTEQVKFDRKTLEQTIFKNQSMLTDAHKKEMAEIMAKWTDDELTFYANLSARTTKNNYYEKRTGWYAPGEKKIHMDMDYSWMEGYLKLERKGAFNTKFHEEFHQLDHILARGEFIENEADRIGIAITSTFIEETGAVMKQAIEKDILKIINDRLAAFPDEYGKTTPIKTLGRITKDQKKAFFDTLDNFDDYSGNQREAALAMLTDAAGLVTSNRLPIRSMGYIGHYTDYNKEKGADGATSETWATYGAIRLTRSEAQLSAMNKLMPETMKIYGEIFEKVIKWGVKNKLEY